MLTFLWHCRNVFRDFYIFLFFHLNDRALEYPPSYQDIYFFLEHDHNEKRGIQNNIFF